MNSVLLLCPKISAVAAAAPFLVLCLPVLLWFYCLPKIVYFLGWLNNWHRVRTSMQLSGSKFHSSWSNSIFLYAQVWVSIFNLFLQSFCIHEKNNALNGQCYFVMASTPLQWPTLLSHICKCALSSVMSILLCIYCFINRESIPNTFLRLRRLSFAGS